MQSIISILGYRFNRPAQMLRTGHSRMIGIAVHRFDQPFYGLFCDCVAQCARQRGYGLVVSVCGDDFEETIKETYQLNADGWISSLMPLPCDASATLNRITPSYWQVTIWAMANWTRS